MLINTEGQYQIMLLGRHIYFNNGNFPNIIGSTAQQGAKPSLDCKSDDIPTTAQSCHPGVG